MILAVIIFSPSDKKLFLLVAEPIPFPAIRTRPGDGVTGHAPHVFLHASLTDTKTAAARPAKGKCHSTAIAVIILDARSFFPVCGSGGRRFHDCCFKSLMLCLVTIEYCRLNIEYLRNSFHFIKDGATRGEHKDFAPRIRTGNLIQSKFGL